MTLGTTMRRAAGFVHHGELPSNNGHKVDLSHLPVADAIFLLQIKGQGDASPESRCTS
jgi:hypothetical protein